MRGPSPTVPLSRTPTGYSVQSFRGLFALYIGKSELGRAACRLEVSLCMPEVKVETSRFLNLR